jgi:hypothetical protein
LPTLHNMMRAVETAENRPAGQSSSSSVPTIPLPTSIPVDKIPQLIDDAKNVQKLTDQRREYLDRVLK